MSFLTPENDLSRWNRAGLTKFDYIEGNAATYQEDLRSYLRTIFNDDDAVLQWLGDEANDTTLSQWQERLTTQYQSERRDYIWELLRTFARCVHVLAHTANVYSNERFIRTATQWDNLRRLVNMLDYHPAPPASAETYVALTIKPEDETHPGYGEVAKGLAVQSSPIDGSAPIVFETLENLDVDYRLNELRAPNFDRSQKKIKIKSSNTHFNFYAQNISDEINVGQRAILADHNKALAVQVVSIEEDYIRLKIKETNFSTLKFHLVSLRLMLPARWKQEPKLNGNNVAEVSESTGLNVHDVVSYRAGSQYYPRAIKAIEGNRIKFSDSVSNNRNFYPTIKVSSQDTGEGHRFVIPTERGSNKVWLANLSSYSPLKQYERNLDDEETLTILYEYVNSVTTTKVHYLATNTPAAFSTTDTSPDVLSFEGAPESLQSDQWVMLKTSQGKWYSRKINAIKENENDFSIEVENLPAGKVWVLAESVFEQQITARGYDENRTQIASDHSDTSSVVNISLDSLPEALIYGRNIWLVSDDNAQRVVLVEANLLPVKNKLALVVTPSLKDSNFLKYNTRVYANVVLCGHGETKAENVLGNGDRVQSNQQFTYKRENIAFVQDTDFSSGVKASIDVWVDQRRWSQVENLRDSESGDHHYQTALTQDGYLTLSFGDGVNAQRLSSGTNNVRIQARFGNGLQGNLSSHSLVKLKKPHLLVDGVVQPAAATGGGDIETIDSIRTNAPGSVLTLSRAVSINDFAALAKRQSSIWDAIAYSLPERPGATDQIQVVVVPAGGGELGDQVNSLALTLKNQALPGVNVFVKSYQGVLLSLNISIRVDEQAYSLDAVELAVKEALIDTLSLQNSRFSNTIFRSRIYQIVESVEGVENADCVLNQDDFVDESGVSISNVNAYKGDDGFIRKITPSKDQIIFIDDDISPIVIKTEAFYD